MNRTRCLQADVAQYWCDSEFSGTKPDQVSDKQCNVQLLPRVDAGGSPILMRAWGWWSLRAEIPTSVGISDVVKNWQLGKIWLLSCNGMHHHSLLLLDDATLNTAHCVKQKVTPNKLEWSRPYDTFFSLESQFGALNYIRVDSITVVRKARRIAIFAVGIISPYRHIAAHNMIVCTWRQNMVCKWRVQPYTYNVVSLTFQWH